MDVGRGVVGEDFNFGAVGNGETGNGIGGNEPIFVGIAATGGPGKFRFGEIGEEDVIGIDDTSGSALGIDDTELGRFPFEPRDVPNRGAHREVVLAGGFVGDCAVDEELDGCFAGVLAS